MWHLEERESGWRLTDDDGKIIADRMTKENATLIGCAPGLLRACEIMLSIVESVSDDSACQWVHDIINQAKGL